MAGASHPAQRLPYEDGVTFVLLSPHSGFLPATVCGDFMYSWCYSLILLFFFIAGYPTCLLLIPRKIAILAACLFRRKQATRNGGINRHAWNDLHYLPFQAKHERRLCAHRKKMSLYSSKSAAINEFYILLYICMFNVIRKIKIILFDVLIFMSEPCFTGLILPQKVSFSKRNGYF